MEKLSCVKTYDIRGRVPDDLNADIAYRLGRAYASVLGTKKVVMGRDVRPSGPQIQDAFSRGLTDQGCDVIDLGVIGTEEMYFATFHLEGEGVDGGIIATASHNPRGYNGLKMVKKGAVPVSGDSGLNDIEVAARTSTFAEATRTGKRSARSTRAAYIDHVLSYIDTSVFRDFTLVSDPGHGCAGPVVEALAARIAGLKLVKVHHTPDGTFPAGVPNPLLPENRGATAAAVKSADANLGVAFDGDFDRCFFFDERGEFVDGYYMVGLLAAHLIAAEQRETPGASPRIIHDPRLVWNTVEQIEGAGGIPVVSKTGHAFIKERMRKEDALYGGEMSAHHYFRRFAYCDSGMIPWLVVAERMAQTGESLSQMVAAMAKRYPVSGEINRRVSDADACIARAREVYAKGDAQVSEIDGLAVDLANWRFSIRKSNTEPLLRLNIETRGDQMLLDEKVKELLGLVEEVGGEGTTV